jgi:purine-binding chemotaxis protein CheW
MQQIVVFSLGREEYSLPITQVQEIIRYAEPRTIPNAYACVRGVINLRGKIIPVCDLAGLLGLSHEPDGEAKIVIVETQAGVAGLMVDEVDEVLTIGDEQLEPPPTAQSDHIRAIAKVEDRLLVLLDLDRVLADIGLGSLELAA